MKVLKPTIIPFPSNGSFTRASTATYVEGGLVKTAVINEPRWQAGVLLLEKSATNMTPRSAEPQAYWAMTNVTKGTDVVAPDGTTTATPFLETTANSGHSTNFASIAFEAGKRYVLSYYAAEIPAGLKRYVGFLSPAGNLTVSGAGVVFDLATLQNGTILGSGFEYGIQKIGSFYRLWFATVAAITGNAIVQMRITSNINQANQSYIGDVTSGAILWGRQVEQKDSGGPSSFIYTGASTATRSADVITGTGLIYTNATDSRPSWSSGGTYVTGIVVRYNNKIYESLQASNTNNQPDISPTWWLDLGADNISAAFDGKVGSKTIATNSLRMIIAPNSVVDTVAYIETVASTVSTTALDQQFNSVYTYTSGLDNSVITSWYDYFFIDPLGDPLTQVVHRNINSLDPSLIIGVEMVRSGETSLGVFLTGQTTIFGKTQYGVKTGIVDYSKKEVDEFGNINLIERPYSKRLQGDVYVENYNLNKVQRFLYGIRATPVLWMASDDEELSEVSNVYGFYKDFSTTISYPDVSMCSLEVEGLT